MKYGRITLTALTLITILTISAGCSNKNTAVNTDAKETEIMNTVTEAAKETNNTFETAEAKNLTPSEVTSLYPAYEYINGEKLYGFIDEKGTYIIQPGYSSVTDFHDGYAMITGSKDNKIIDKHGKIVYESQYSISPYSNGAAVFTEDILNNGYLDTKGKVILKPVYVYADNFRKDNTAFVSPALGKYALINKSGTVLEEYRLDKKYDNVITFKDGYIIYSNGKTNKEGVVNYKGKEIYKPVYNSITYLGNDLFAIKDPSLKTSRTPMTGPAALYDNKGKQLTDYVLYDLSEFHDGYASATNSQYTYFIDTAGKEVSALPRVEGRGTMTLMGNIIKAEIDDDLIYMKKDKTVIWQNDRTHNLPDITIKELKYKPNKYAYVYYPYIEGMPNSIQAAVNGKLYELFTRDRADLKESSGLSVSDTFQAELMNNLLIITKNGYDYPYGAAHGTPVRNTYHIDIKTGEFYDLSDLFKKKSDYADRISKIIGSRINEQVKKGELTREKGFFQGITENQFFSITKEALVIYFAPYENAQDFPEYKISYDQIRDIIDYDGSFWNSFQDSQDSLTDITTSDQ